MKKVMLSLIGVIIIAIACNKKSIPVITERKTEQPKPVISNISTIIADTSIGKIVFTNRCGRCHGLPEPGQFTAKRWDGILSYMIPRAKLNEEQGAHVTAFVISNAGK